MSSHICCFHGNAPPRPASDSGHISLTPGYVELPGGPSGEPLVQCHSLSNLITLHGPNKEPVEFCDSFGAPGRGCASYEVNYDNSSAAKEFHCHTPNYPCCRKIIHARPKAPPHPCRERPHQVAPSASQALHMLPQEDPHNEEQQPCLEPHQRHCTESQHKPCCASPFHHANTDQPPMQHSCKQPLQSLSPDDFISFRENPSHTSPCSSQVPPPKQMDPCERQAPGPSTGSEKQSTRQGRNIVYGTSPQYEELVPVPSCKPSSGNPSHFNHLSFKDKQLVMSALRKTAPALEHSNLLQEKDKNNSGCIGKRDFEVVMDKVGCLKDLSSRELDAIFKGFPSSNDAVLNYKKYICACEEALSKPTAF